jgi:hypothetical protein
MAEDLTFGPDGDQWHYNRSTKTYDLTRGSAKASHKIQTTWGPQDTFISIAPEITALVVVDMQNFFLHPSCMEHPTGLAAVEPTIKVINKCRELGIQARNLFSSSRYSSAGSVETQARCIMVLDGTPNPLSNSSPKGTSTFHTTSFCNPLDTLFTLVDAKPPSKTHQKIHNPFSPTRALQLI